jgi:hypothetical protein
VSGPRRRNTHSMGGTSVRCLQRCMKRANQGLFTSPAWQTRVHRPQPSIIVVGYLEAETIYLLAAC